MDGPWTLYQGQQEPAPPATDDGPWKHYQQPAPVTPPWEMYRQAAPPAPEQRATNRATLPFAKEDDGTPIAGVEPPPAAPAPDESATSMGARMRAGLAPTPQPQEAQPEDPNGVMAAAKAGLVKSVSDIAAAPGAIAGKAPQEQSKPAPFEEPLHFGDLLNPSQAAPKIAYSLASSVPSLFGGIAGGAAATAIAPEAGPLAPLAGGALGAGAVTAVQTLAPYYAEAMKQPGATPDKAFDAALAKAGQSGAFSAAGWALFGLTPFASAAKNLLAQAFVVQPAAGVAQRGVENVEAGQPVTQGMGEAALNSAAGVLPLLAGHAAVHAMEQPAAPAVHADAAALTDLATQHQMAPKSQAQQSAEGVLANIAQGKPAETPAPQAASAEPAPLPDDHPARAYQTPPPEAAPEPAAKPAPYVMVRPGDLTLDPKTFQYKEADENGVTGALQGVTRWNSDLADPIDAYRADDGNLYVVNGHQRTDLAKRAEADGQPDVQIPARIYDAADGYTPEQMRYLGAYRNIAQGSGTAIDAAKILRQPAPDGFTTPDLPPRSAMVQQARGLSGLSDEAFGAVVNGVVPPEQAAEVGRQIADPKQQMAAIQVLHQTNPASVEQARILVQDVKNSGFLDGTQEDMFGTQAFAQSLFPERAKVLAQALQNLRGNKRVFKAAVEGEDALTSAGNQMDTTANQKGQTENEQLIDTLNRAATTKGPLSDALSAAARDVAGGKQVRGAAGDFLAQARAIVRRSPEVGLAGSPDTERAGPESAGGEGLELPPQEGAGLFSNRQKTPEGPSEVSTEHPAFQAVAEHLSRFLGVPDTVTLKLFDKLGGGTQDGSYAGKLIKFALDTKPEDVPAKLFHEIVHALRDPSLGLLSNAERLALDAGASRYLATGDNRAQIVARYSADGKPPSADVIHEEAIARMAEQALQGALARPSLIQRVAQRMVNFVTGLGQALRGQGFKTADDVFRGLMQGEHAGQAAGAFPSAVQHPSELYAKRPLITDKAGLEKEGQGALFGRSAVQAQAARDAMDGRGRGDQKPLDEGLFAHAAAAQPATHGQPMHDMAAELIKWGKANGRERLASYDPLTNEIKHQATGEEKVVQMSPEMRRAIHQSANALVFQHNHPSSSAISKSDIGQLIYPGMSWVVAHGHDGSFSAAKAPDGTVPTHDTKGDTDPMLGRAQQRMFVRHESARVSASSFVNDLIHAGHFSFEDIRSIWNDIVNRTMAIRGDIDYLSSFKLPPVVRDALRSYAKVIASGRSLDEVHRLTESVQPSDGIARVAEDGRRLAQQRTAGALVDSRSAQVDRGAQAQPVTGRPPLVKGEQGRLFSIRDTRDVAERERAVTQYAMDLQQSRGMRSLEPIKAIARNALEIFSPTSLAGAKPTEHLVRRNAAEQARSFARTVADLSDMRDAMNRLPVEDQYAFTDRMEAGEKQATPELQAVSDMLRASFDGWAKRIQSLGHGLLETTRENYAPHIWGNYKEWKAGLPDDPNANPMDRAKAGAMSKSPIRGSGAFLKQRTFETQREGMEAGLVPVSTNPVDMAMIKLREMQKMYHGTRMADEMKQTGISQWVPVSEEGAARSAGWVKLADPVFNPTTNEGGGRTEYGSYWAPQEAARIFNNYTSKGLAGSPIYDAIRASGNALNQLQLGLSGFHATFVTLDSAISKAALGVRQMSRGQILKGAGNIAMATPPLIPVAAGMTAYRGAQLRKAILYPDAAPPELKRIANLAMTAGARVSQQQVFRTDASGSFVRNLGDFTNGHVFREIAATVRNSPVMAPFHLAGRTIETLAQPLMELYVPRAKLGVFYDMARDWTERNPDATPEATADAMTKAWDSVDNRMGQMIYDNLFWSKTGKDLAFVTTRSVGWNLGTIRELAGAGVDTVDQLARAVQRKPVEVTHRMAYAMAMPMVTGMLGATIGYLSGQPPQEPIDYFYPKKSDGTRLAIPGYIKDVIDYTHAPFQTIANKAHPLASMAQQLANNRDYYGGIIYDPQRDDAVRAYLGYILNQTEPFALRAIQKENTQGATPWERVAAFWGFQPAPAAISNPERGDAFQRKENTKAFRKREREPGRTELPSWVP